MRIAVNTRLLIPGKMDGIGRFSFESLKHISQSHPEVKFDFIFDRKVDLGAAFPANVKFHVLNLPARHPILWYLWFEHRLKNFVNKGYYDLFLSPEGWIPPKLNCKSLGVIHDINFEHYPENIIFSHRKYLQHYFRKYAKRADRIATVSKYSKKDIQQTYSVPEDKIDIVYNGVNSIFKPVSLIRKKEIQEKFTDGLPFFIFIGTLHPRKNLEHLFLGFERFKQETKANTKLVIAGSKKWWPKKLERIYQSMSFQNDVLFLGRRSDKELSELVASAEALTYLPYFEGFGIPILEAFKSACPVICSNVTSMPEVADSAALLCNPTDVKEISLAMQRLTTDENLVRSLTEKGKKVVTKYSWGRTASLLWESIEKTISVGT